MTALSTIIVDKFCELCDWAHTVWLVQRTFEADPRTEVAAQAGHGDLFANLSTVLVEYALLQIAKLHDPACQQGRANLTLAYVVEYGGWDSATEGKLRGVINELNDLNQRIRPARNRLLGHNDLAAILAEAPLGAFPSGLDDRYFEALRGFVSLVRESTGAMPFEFTPFAQSDVLVLLNALVGPAVAEA